MQVVILLFYKYVKLQDPEAIQTRIRELCTSLDINGRVLLATEGINSNVAGSKEAIDTFMAELSKDARFHGIDFKLDQVESDHNDLFPDLKVHVQSEICSTGNTMKYSLLEKGMGGTHLSPEDFHAVLKQYWVDHKKQNGKDLVVIDVRNRKEFELGRFEHKTDEQANVAVDPDTRVFTEFGTVFGPRRASELKDKKVLMYCTGGIRCEKASAYLQSLGVKDVSQLNGGIHRYMEKFGSDGFFKGKNFVFDRRGLQNPASMKPGTETTPENSTAGATDNDDSAVLGMCFSCDAKDEGLSSDRVCAVCRDTLLVCDSCRQKRLGVYFCRAHKDLDGVYFPFLDPLCCDLATPTLQAQVERLTKLRDEMIRDGLSRNRRQTVSKQIRRLEQAIKANSAPATTTEGEATGDHMDSDTFATSYKICAEHNKVWKTVCTGESQPQFLPRCRACGRFGPKPVIDGLFQPCCCNGGELVEQGAAICQGNCWGFFGEKPEHHEHVKLANGNAKATDVVGNKAEDVTENNVVDNKTEDLNNTRITEGVTNTSTTPTQANDTNRPKREAEDPELVEKRKALKRAKRQARIQENKHFARDDEGNLIKDKDGKPISRKKKMRMDRKQRKKERRRQENHFNETEYDIDRSNPEVPLRRVVPYVHCYNTDSKGRWHGRTILDVFAREFGANDPAYYERSIKHGLITVNGERVGTEYVVKGADVIQHWTHRHEPPCQYVPADEIVAFEDDNILIANKPGSVPVHPSGSYRYNSLTTILTKERASVDQLFTIHRLDRLTSGLVVLTKNRETAQKIQIAMKRKGESGTVTKTYVAKVHGKFPSNQQEAEARPSWQTLLRVLGNHPYNSDEARKTSGEKVDQPNVYWGANVPVHKSITDVWAVDCHVQSVMLSCPLRCESHKCGSWACSFTGTEEVTMDTSPEKPSLSRFQLLAYDEATDTSVVQCEPITGRTHQLRLHLQALDFPINNDPNYGERLAMFQDEDVERPTKVVKLAVDASDEAKDEPTGDMDVDGVPWEEGASMEQKALANCRYCKLGEDVAFSKVQMRNKCIHLHAFRYASEATSEDDESWDWVVPLPKWAEAALVKYQK